MPVIVDANVATQVFYARNSTPYWIIWDEIYNNKRNVFHYGGKLTEEYRKTYEVFKIIKILDSAGLAINIPDSKVKPETTRLVSEGNCVSNDQHVLALARVGGARILCSNDRKLIQDFKNKNLINKPRGKVFSAHPRNRAFKNDCSVYSSS